jgi:peptidyl-prolyl cis-trans isomerase SurA
MNRLRSLVLLLLAGAAPLAAQDATVRAGPSSIDRIVAIVGTRPILFSEVLEVIGQNRARGVRVPEDSVGGLNYARQVRDELVDEEILVQRAESDTSITVADADLTETVETQLKRLRENFRSDQEFLTGLRNAGFGNLEEYKRWLTEQARRRELQQRLIQKMQRDGKMIPVAVSDQDVTEAYEQNRTQLPKRPPAVTFRQVVVATQASQQARDLARAKAESLLADIRRGSDFEQVAKRESMDPQSKEQGGDLGWSRRSEMVPEFERVMFSLPPGQVSNVVETQYGYHIIRVDRAKPSEVKVRHILIKPEFDSTDIARARVRADSVLRLWQSGTPLDTLQKRYHDPDELEGSLEPFPRQQLPPSYATAFEGKGKGDYVGPFSIDDPRRGVPKFVVAQITESIEAGDYTVQDLREQIRQQLAQERSYRRLLEQLKKEVYVALLPIEGSTKP